MPTTTKATDTAAAATEAAAKAAKALFDTAAMQEQILTGVKQINQTTLDAVSAWVDAVGKVTSKLPNVPFAAERKSAITGSLNFYGQLVTAQSDLAVGLLDAVAPLAATK